MSFRPALALLSLPEGFARMRAPLAALATAGCGWLALRLVPAAEMEVFARMAAWLAAGLTGSPSVRVETGWMLAGLEPRLVVSAACSATDYFLVTATLFAWHFARRSVVLPGVIGGGLAVALPVTWFINALRIVFVGQAHRWIIPLFPDAYAGFLHLAAGVIVFLPALVALNLVLELHGHPARRSRCRR